MPNITLNIDLAKLLELADVQTPQKPSYQPASGVRVLKTHYVVERKEHYDQSIAVIAQFHSRRDADAFIKATRHALHLQRIICVTKRNRDQKSENPWT